MPEAQFTTADHTAHLLTQIADEQSQAAFSEIFKYFAPRLHAFAARQFGSEQIAMDIVQETMTNVWQKAHLFQPDKGSATTWIFTIARNVRFDILRKSKHRAHDLSADDLWPILAEQETQVRGTDNIEQVLLIQQIEHYLERLPEAQRVIIQLLYVDGKSQQETADLLDIPLGTVKSRSRLAIQKLQALVHQND